MGCLILPELLRVRLAGPVVLDCSWLGPGSCGGTPACNGATIRSVDRRRTAIRCGGQPFAGNGGVVRTVLLGGVVRRTTCASAVSTTSCGWSVSFAAQSRKLERKPCGTAAMSSFLSNSDRKVSLTRLPQRFGNTSGLSGASGVGLTRAVADKSRNIAPLVRRVCAFRPSGTDMAPPCGSAPYSHPTRTARVKNIQKQLMFQTRIEPISGSSTTRKAIRGCRSPRTCSWCSAWRSASGPTTSCGRKGRAVLRAGGGVAEHVAGGPRAEAIGVRATGRARVLAVRPGRGASARPSARRAVDAVGLRASTGGDGAGRDADAAQRDAGAGVAGGAGARDALPGPGDRRRPAQPRRGSRGPSA